MARWSKVNDGGRMGCTINSNTLHYKMPSPEKSTAAQAPPTPRIEEAAQKIQPAGQTIAYRSGTVNV